jgi:transketolase
MADLMGTRETYGEVLAEMGHLNKDIVVLDADLSSSTMTKFFAKEFPDRFFNMGVSEQDMMGTAAGLALSGKIPFASTFAVFAAGRAWEQVRQAIAYPGLNVKIVASHGGISVGEDGASHQMTEDIALMRVLPNMTVIIPADGMEMREIMNVLIATQGPFYVRTSRMKFPVIYKDGASFTIGKGSIVKNGSDLTVIAIGYMVHEALKAADTLAKEGISIRVVNMSTIKPIDRELIVACAKETGAIITAEEHSIIGGLGGAVCEVLSETVPTPVRRIGIQDRFCSSGVASDLFKQYGLNAGNIETTARQMLASR